MSSTFESQNVYSESQDTWEVSVDRNGIFTNDDVINAFLKGKEIGVKQKSKYLLTN